jgi:hypothetical protein
MPRALWLLFGLQIKGWLRYARRNFSSVRGVLFFLVGLLFFGMCIVSLIFNPSTGNRPNPQNLDRFGPLALLAMCLVNFFLATGERVISFRPAEIDFLFPGPFTRRQLLMYKVVGILATTLIQSLFFQFFLRTWGNRFLATFLGSLLLLLFFQFLTLALTMLAAVVGATAYSRGRRAVLVLLVGALAVVGYQVFLSEGDVNAALNKIEESPVWQAVRTPLSWFVLAFRAEHIWPDLVRYASLALLIDLALVAVLFALDAQYLEASAAASERHYRRLESMRSGQGLLAARSRSGRARFSLPMFPRLAGIGPTLWRQWLMVLRSYLLVFLVLGLGAAGLSPVIVSMQEGAGSKHMVITATAVLVGFPIMLTPSILCDFRGDLDRMEVLKALPIRPTWLVVGQLLSPSLVVLLVQAIVAAAAMVLFGRFEPLLAAVPLLGLPVNFVIFGIENMLFLFFPMRMVATSPGDFQTSGRHMLNFFAKFLCFTPVGIVASLAAVVTGLATDSVPAGLAAAWFTVLASGIAIVPLVVTGFKRFDVATDTPI